MPAIHGSGSTCKTWHASAAELRECEANQAETAAILRYFAIRRRERAPLHGHRKGTGRLTTPVPVRKGAPALGVLLAVPAVLVLCVVGGLAAAIAAFDSLRAAIHRSDS